MLAYGKYQLQDFEIGRILTDLIHSNLKINLAKTIYNSKKFVSILPKVQLIMSAQSSVLLLPWNIFVVKVNSTFVKIFLK